LQIIFTSKKFRVYQVFALAAVTIEFSFPCCCSKEEWKKEKFKGKNFVICQNIAVTLITFKCILNFCLKTYRHVQTCSVVFLKWKFVVSHFKSDLCLSFSNKLKCQFTRNLKTKKIINNFGEVLKTLRLHTRAFRLKWPTIK
jgi:hypothetical protein